MIFLKIPTYVLENHKKYMCEDYGNRTCLKSLLTSIMKKCQDPINYKNSILEDYNLKKRSKKKKRKVIESIENYYLLSLKDEEIETFGEILNMVISEMENLTIGNTVELNRINNYYEKKLLECIPQNFEFRKYVETFIGEKFLNAYTNFSRGGYINKDMIWNRFEYVNKFKLNVCPYCNANFILTIKSDSQVERLEKKKLGTDIDKRRGTSPELDHFLPKDKYPLLAMSPYNLVPSCKVCNQSLKGNIDFNYEEFYSPFEEGIDNSFRFYRRLLNERNNLDGNGSSQEYKIDKKNIPDYVSAILGNSDQFTIAIKYDEKANCTEEENAKFRKKVSGNVKYLRLEEVYNLHRPYLQKLFIQFQIYNELYKSQLEREFPKLFMELDKILNIVTPKEGYKDVILSKMVSEIIEDEITVGKHKGDTKVLVKLKHAESLL